MNPFQYRGDELYAEELPVTDIAAHFGTPCYVYSRAALEHHWRTFDTAFRNRPHLICFAVKANSNLAVLNVLARLGSGFDIVSGGELARVLAAGGEASKVVFSGVGKRDDEIRQALALNIRCFNIESEQELERIDAIAAEMGKQAPVALRVNPNVDAHTHPYIATGLKGNKFGIDIHIAETVYRRAVASPNLLVKGITCHIGSQLTELSPFLDALEEILELVDKLEHGGIPIAHLDLGGGLGIRYTDEQPPGLDAYTRALDSLLEGYRYEIVLEPGRAIAGNAGILLTRVEYIKPTEYRHFAIVDAAMNDLLRPSLYQARHRVMPARRKGTGTQARYDLVGPVCETGDFLAKGQDLTLAQGDLLAVCSSGAYGFTLSSNYNSRPRIPELMVDGPESYLVRRRESLADLYRGESVLPV